METYVDIAVGSVPNDKKDEYVSHSRSVSGIFKEHGALSVVDCWGDDVPDGELTSFKLAVKCEDSETVCVSWIIWPSKSVRDEGMKKFMEDPRITSDETPMPFDMKRMIFGGFRQLYEI